MNIYIYMDFMFWRILYIFMILIDFVDFTYCVDCFDLLIGLIVLIGVIGLDWFAFVDWSDSVVIGFDWDCVGYI